MLDTRQKILNPEQALAALKGCHVLVAYFDILSIQLTRRIAEIGHPVVVVLPDPPDPVLSTRTRAELAASLALVEAVVPVHDGLTSFLEALEPAKIIHWESEDAQRTASLIDHVQSKH